MKTQTGFTLIELIVTLAVAAILTVVVEPGFQSVVRNYELTTQINELVTALNLARSEALKRHGTVSLCKSADGVSCGESSSHWEDGWVVFVNSDNDDPAAVDPGETLVRAFAGLKAGYTLRGNGNVASFISFTPTGEVNTGGRLVLCYQGKPNYARVILVDAAGHIRAASRNAAGVPEDENGNPITSCGL